MSKLLKAIAQRHRPRIADKMVPENGYDEVKHTHPASLHKAKIINDNEFTDLEECLDELSKGGDPAANVLKNTKPGSQDKQRLNDADFVNALMASGAGVGGDDNNTAAN